MSDATFARAEKRFGKPAVVDLLAINGYYTFLAMPLNAARYAIPERRDTIAALPRVAPNGWCLIPGEKIKVCPNRS